jgi:hypothetical protein
MPRPVTLPIDRSAPSNEPVRFTFVFDNRVLLSIFLESSF